MRVHAFIALLLIAFSLSACAACPPGYHLGPYGRRCWPNAGPYYPRRRVPTCPLEGLPHPKLNQPVHHRPHLNRAAGGLYLTLSRRLM